MPLWGGDHTLNLKELEHSRFKSQLPHTARSVQPKPRAQGSAWLCSTSSGFSSKSLASQPLWGDMRGPEDRRVIWGCRGSPGFDMWWESWSLFWTLKWPRWSLLRPQQVRMIIVFPVPKILGRLFRSETFVTEGLTGSTLEYLGQWWPIWNK